ncbi:S100P-binding protein isoform X3 [Rhinoderma darwinii]|uniref:S100P-binding protein isoform X3 n=1 Tax=Rhinoderma darwinii TaxID=43563 RepID=UPI003F668D46
MVKPEHLEQPMKVINDPTVPGACSERQVLFYPIDWEDPLPATMEEIKIRIVNDRATGSKRERDEVTAVTPCSKRSRHAVFSCSTPLSASARAWSSQSKHAKEHPDFPAWHALQQNPEQDDEWDDSLLEPSDNEDDSPLFLTLDEIETLLDDDDEDDSCYAAEPSQNNNEMPTCVVTFAPSVSENEGLAKVHHHPAGPESPKESLPFTTSSTVTTEPQLSTDPSGTKQTAESKKPSEAEEKKVMQNVESTSMQTDPSPSAAPRTNSKQSKNVTTSGCKAQGSSAPGKEKPRIAIAALPRPTFRSFLSDFELETNKQVYCNQVLMHVNGQGECNLENPHYELASLLNQTSRENQNWQHPSDFTKRNHPRFGKKPSKRCTLHQWATKNGGSNERFKNFPAIFQRSPIPDVLPYSSS